MVNFELASCDIHVTFIIGAGKSAGTERRMWSKLIL